MPHFDDRKVEKLVPIPNELVIPVVLGATAKRILRPFDQRRGATELPRDKPMHYQLRGIVDDFLVNLPAHRFRLKISIRKRNTFWA